MTERHARNFSAVCKVIVSLIQVLYCFMVAQNEGHNADIFRTVVYSRPCTVHIL